MTLDVNVHLIDFKTAKGNEMVVENEDGSYTILINSRLSYTGQLKAYEHAIWHIENKDFERTNVQEIEAIAHGMEASQELVPADKYVENIKRLRAERRKTQRLMQKDKERVQFIRDHCDMFRKAESNYLYGSF